MEKKRIVWVDDEIETSILRPYIDAFEENGYEIIKVKNVDNLMPVLKRESKKALAAILVDIIMPPESYDFGKARAGLRTGVLVLNQLRSDVTFCKIPTIVVTNADGVNIDEFCINLGIKCLKKEDYFADSFVEEINTLLNT